MNFSFLFQFWVVAIAGKINEYQYAIIAYKDEEIRYLREQLKKATGKTALASPTPNASAWLPKRRSSEELG